MRRGDPALSKGHLSLRENILMNQDEYCSSNNPAILLQLLAPNHDVYEIIGGIWKRLFALICSSSIIAFVHDK